MKLGDMVFNKNEYIELNIYSISFIDSNYNDSYASMVATSSVIDWDL
jgi:Fic family protein